MKKIQSFRFLSHALLITGITASMLNGCKQEETKELPKDIAQIQAENGIPVRTVAINIAPITEIRQYSGSVEGKDMTMVKATVGEKVEKFYVKIGSYVQRDQVVAQLKTDGNSAQYRNMKESLAMLEKTYARMKAVFEKGGITQQQLDEVESQLKIQRTNWEVLQKETTLTSTETGVVTDLFVEEGATVEANTNLMSISKINRLVVTLPITSHEIHQFKKGLKAFIELGDQRIEGEVTEVPLAANPTTRFFPVEVEIRNDDRKLLPNMYVETSVRLRTDTTAVIPNAALTYKDGQYSVFKVEKDKAHQIPVTLGIRADEFSQVLEGLQPQDQVIIAGQSRLRDGDKIKVIQ